MLTYITNICQSQFAYLNNFFYNFYQKTDIIFFDIETTGLSHTSSRVYLIGAVTFENTDWKFTQFLAEKDSSSEEQALLTAFASFAHHKKCFIHYNGSSFDIPYLKDRYTFYGILSPFGTAGSLDLYQTLRPLRPYLQLENFRQKSLEPLAGYHRNDTLDGKELIKVFQAFSLQNTEPARKLLLLHNHDDLEGMTFLLAFLALAEVFRGNFDSLTWKPVTARSIDGLLTDEILFQIEMGKDFPSDLTFSFEDGKMTVHKNLCRIKLPLLEGTLKYFYPDHKNYYYLPAEDEAIHKSVGTYVDPHCRVQAKACNCYKNVSGYFLKACGTPSLPLFRPAFKSNDIYVLWNNSLKHDPKGLHSFLKEYLHAHIPC